MQVMAEIELDIGHPDIDRMLVSLAHLCGVDSRLLLVQRDETLEPGTLVTCCWIKLSKFFQKLLSASTSI